MDIAETLNPFRTWADLAKDLRDKWVAEMSATPNVSAYTGETLGKLAGLVTTCNHLGTSLDQLRRHDAAAYDAFLRALEKS